MGTTDPDVATCFVSHKPPAWKPAGTGPATEADLPLTARTQRRHWARRVLQRFPSGDGPGACPRLRVVGDPWEPAAQLDGGGQLALLIENSADRGGIGLGDGEHPVRMGPRTAADKRGVSPLRWQRIAKPGHRATLSECVICTQ